MNKLHAVFEALTLFLSCLIVSTALWALAQQQAPAVGVALPQGPAVFETSLQSRISSTDTSMTLVSNSLRGGESLSGYVCFTLDEGRSDSEFVCGDVSGTTVANLVRGVSFGTGTTTNSALRFAHRVGANVKVTDFPLIQRMRHQLSGSDTIDGILKYTSHPTFTATTDIVDKKYVDDAAFSGAGVIDATTVARGVCELATQGEAASSSSQGGSGVLCLTASTATSTWNSATAPLRLVVTQNNGFIDPNFLKLASSTHATTSVAFGWGNVTILPPLAAPAATNTILAFSGTAPYRMSFVEEGWTLIESTTTASAMNSATTTAITGASANGFRELKVFVRTAGINTADGVTVRFNNDVSANYGYRSFINYGASTLSSAADYIGLMPESPATTSPAHLELTISNPTSARKQLHWMAEANSATTIVPDLYSGAGVWNNTSNPITSILVKTVNGNTFNAGMIISVYGKRN